MIKLLVCFLLTTAFYARAQEDDLLPNEPATSTAAPAPSTTPDGDDMATDSGYESEIGKGNRKGLLDSELNKRDENETSKKDDKIDKVSELDRLVPFKDIAVIQKRFLPKTSRFEFYPNLGFVTNNAFFFSAFIQGRLGYGLSEKWTIEAIAAFFTNSKYKVTKDLKDKESVDTESHLLTKGYYGLDLRWNPLYGKMGVFDHGILPFDMYFSLGAGMMSTNQSTNPMAIHIGTGQIFAIKKSMAFRWDLSGYFYSSDTKVASSGKSGTNHESFQDIQLGIGMSFFFPEAKYR
jgi:outer membrane beta-barrel protein